MTIDVARDTETLRAATVELLEEEFAYSRVRRVLDTAEGDDRDHALASVPPRPRPAGYYVWAGYLLWLEARIEAGVRFHCMAACEMEGLVNVKRARGEWESRHPACACGARQDSRFQPRCTSCGLDFHQREAA